jgi:thiol-disulfide isomerase/thioredoxin
LCDFRDKNNVLLVFWASWCVPCIDEIKIFKEKYSNSYGTEIILISALDKDSVWRDAIEKYNLKKFINIFDPETSNNLYTKYAIPFLPTSILINKKGKIIGRYEGLQTNQLLKDIANLNLSEN